MRMMTLTAAALFAATPVLASSIEVIQGERVANNSMIKMNCTNCPPPRPKEAYSGYKVPLLEAGVQKEEIQDINGERMIVRTERWMGGSPTVFYQKLTPETEAAMMRQPVIGPQTPSELTSAPTVDGIDASTTTAAVEPVRTEADFAGFELRLN